MKLNVLIFFLSIAINTLGQECYLANIDTNKTFGVEYWFHFDQKKSESSCEINKIADKEKSQLKVITQYGEVVPFTKIQIQNYETGTINELTTDSNGLAYLQLDKGKYNLSAISVGFKVFETKFNIDFNHSFELLINLGISTEIRVYQIDSKKKLKDRELNKIVNCIKKRPKEFHKCSCEKKYLVQIQI